MATLYRFLIALNGMQGPNLYQAGGADLAPGYCAMEDDADDVALCTAGSHPIGIIGCPSYHDLNTVYTAGEKVPVWMRGCGIVCYVLHDNDTGAATITRGTKLAIDDANDGCVQSWAYSDTAEATDTLAEVIGTLEEEVTISGDTPTFVKCRMSL
jgi:hypothetical protein